MPDNPENPDMTESPTLPEDSGLPANPQHEGNRKLQSGNLILVGMMGSGKTTMGRVLAKHFGKAFVDSDEEIQRRNQRGQGRIKCQTWHCSGLASLTAELSVGRPGGKISISKEKYMESAIFGLVGVALGALLTVAKEWWFQRSRNRKDAEYLSIQVSCALERYVAHCAKVVSDDGLRCGQPDKDGCSSIQVLPPTFEPELLKVEWKSLPANLMYEVLDFPYKAEVASQSVDDAFEDDHPPDFDEGFEERHFQYATLGIAASKLAAELRQHVGLPTRTAGDWDPVRYMQEQKSAIELRRMERAKIHSLTFNL